MIVVAKSESENIYAENIVFINESAGMDGTTLTHDDGSKTELAFDAEIKVFTNEGVELK